MPKVSAATQQRGDLQLIKSFASFEHLLTLTDDQSVHDLSDQTVHSG
ncbi:hypothetical protein [Deinococcus psychrotolerans]|nr:hypothetical protein [Deinococcus psychrotolerans]